jgi:hypothetical protein
VEDAAEHIAQIIGWIRRSIDLEKVHGAPFDPLLGGDILELHVPGTAAGTAVMGNHDGALLIFAGGSWSCYGNSSQ